MLKTLLVALLLVVTASASFGSDSTQPAHRLQFRFVANANQRDAADELPMFDQPDQKLRVLKHVEMDDRDLESAGPIGTQNNGGPSMEITFIDDGAQKFSRLTAANIGRRVAIVFDGMILSAPTIRSRIGRKGVISFGSNTTPQEAKILADTLNQMIDERGPTTEPAAK